MNRRAEMGVGTLIIFISLLLVAAVAAGVLIQTAGSLQQRALSTGAQATGQISTNALVLEVSATDGTADVNNFSQILKLAPGSDSIKLDEVTLTLSTKNSTQTLDYLEFGTGTNASTANSNGNMSGFGVHYLQTGANSQTGVLVRGDVIRINYIAERALGEGEHVRVNFIPKIGTATLTEFDMPDVMSTQRVYLYP